MGDSRVECPLSEEEANRLLSLANLARLRSNWTEVVPVVVATFLPLSWPMLVMPEAALTAMRTSST